MVLSTRAFQRQRRRQQPRPHRCPASYCRIFVPAHRLACSDHWFSLPEELRGRINATFRRDFRAHLQAYREAVRLLTTGEITTIEEEKST